MSYRFSGHFIESCDCTVICPCWVDDDPVGGHCTGFIAWQIDQGGIAVVDGTRVDGCKVVSVATHAGNRRDGDNTTTMLYIDVPQPEASTPGDPGGATGTADGNGATTEPDPDEQFRVLVELFCGRRGGPLAELSQVSGTVVGAARAHIEIGDHSGSAVKDSWRVAVRPRSETPPGTVLVHATGHPTIFDADRGNSSPLTLEHTAISYELKASGPVVAQHGDRLVVNVGALPAGSLEVTGRSGMRGDFSYDHDDSGKVPPPERDEEPA